MAMKPMFTHTIDVDGDPIAASNFRVIAFDLRVRFPHAVDTVRMRHDGAEVRVVRVSDADGAATAAAQRWADHDPELPIDDIDYADLLAERAVAAS